MSTSDGRYTLVYNGEIYNYRELRDELGNVALRSSSDSEVLLEAFARWGPDCLDRFVGMFAFAIWDALEQQLFCARDRVGIKPFYCTRGWGTTSCSLPSCADCSPRVFLARSTSGFFTISWPGITTSTTMRRSSPGFTSCRRRGWMVIGADGQTKGPQVYWRLADDVARVKVPRSPEEREDALLSLCSEAVDLALAQRRAGSCRLERRVGFSNSAGFA